MSLNLGISKSDAKFSLAYLSVAFAALFIGGLAGVLQGLARGGMLELPGWIDYYELLTAHGLMLVVVLSSFFSIGYLYAGTSRTLGGIPRSALGFGWIGFYLMVAGGVLATICVLSGNASVMYTFYTPLQATPWFYVGLALVVVGIWFNCVGMFITFRKWKKENPGKSVPLFAFFSMGVFVLWFIAGAFVASEVLFLIIPWAFGWVDTTNPLLGRTLFWAFGHTLVNIWMITAVSAWYVIMPKIIGGKIFSDVMAKIAVVLYVIFNVPGGFHHQIVDPGLSIGLKFMHVIMTFLIVFPSLMTAFVMFATFEMAGKEKGAKGLFGWWRKLPWGDARFFPLMVAMLAFIPAGAGGIINASFQMNQIVHNSIWVTGHLHLTVGTSVVLTFFGISYWLIPVLTKRIMTSRINRLAITQTITWAVGMIMMSGAMHINGLLGAPRRTSDTSYFDDPVAAGWALYESIMAVGGVILFIGILLQVYIVLHLMFWAPRGQTEFPIAESEPGTESTPLFFDRWIIWIIIALAVISVAYIIPIFDMLFHDTPGSPPYRTW
jgi:cytochrome c oxidase subunit 1